MCSKSTDLLICQSQGTYLEFPLDIADLITMSSSYWDHIAGETLDKVLEFMAPFGLIVVSGSSRVVSPLRDIDVSCPSLAEGSAL